MTHMCAGGVRFETKPDNALIVHDIPLLDRLLVEPGINHCFLAMLNESYCDLCLERIQGARS